MTLYNNLLLKKGVGLFSGGYGNLFDDELDITETPATHYRLNEPKHFAV